MSRLAVPENVGVDVVDGVVYVAPLPDGPISVLDGIAALIWDAALEVDREVLAEAIAAATATPVAQVEGSVIEFVDDLVRRGLLVARA